MAVWAARLRSDGFGGVFLACNKHLASRAISINSDCEIEASCIELTHTNKVILCAIAI